MLKGEVERLSEGEEDWNEVECNLWNSALAGCARYGTLLHGDDADCFAQFLNVELSVHFTLDTVSFLFRFGSVKGGEICYVSTRIETSVH